MLTINVTLLHGTMRATSADDRTLAGDDDPGDWPPSPARLVAALVAGDGTRDRCRVTTGAELSLFERAAAPRIHACARSDVLVSPLRDRYVVVNRSDDGAVQEYPARKAQLVRPGPRLCPRDRRIAYVWDDIMASPDELRALAARAARVAYLGCADSPVRVGVASAFDPSSAPAAVWEPGSPADQDVPVPFPGFVEVLDRAFDDWTGGLPARRAWYRTHRQGYRSPERREWVDERAASPTVLWLRFDRWLPGRTALRVSGTLKAAVLDLYQRDVAGPSAEVPAVLHGHGFEGQSGYQIAQWAVLPDVGHAHARGRLHGAAIMLPADTDPTVIAGVRHVLWRLRELVVPGLAPVEIRPDAGEGRPLAAHPQRWKRKARRWASALPVVHERRQRHGPDLEEIARWCEHADLPRPVQARVSPLPMIEGGLILAPTEVLRQRQGASRPYSHLELVFDREVSGPVVLGRARQFGMGLMAPLP